jgi:hypothetical protein
VEKVGTVTDARRNKPCSNLNLGGVNVGKSRIRDDILLLVLKTLLLSRLYSVETEGDERHTDCL